MAEVHLHATCGFLQQSAGAEPLVEVRGGNAKLRATLAEKKHIEKIRLATGIRKGPTFRAARAAGAPTLTGLCCP